MRFSFIACAAFFASLLLLGSCPEQLFARDVATALGRVRVSGSLRSYTAFRFDRGTPKDDPSAEIALESELKRADWGRLVVKLIGGFDGRINDPRGRSPIINLSDVYQDKDWYVNLSEAFFDIYLGDVDLRIGKQKISWGRLDEFQFTDNFNPEDWSEFLLRPELERKIGVPAAVADYYVGPWTVEGVWVPWVVPYRLAGERDRWFFPLFRVPAQLLADGAVARVKVSYPDIDIPARTLANSEVGLKVSRRLAGVDLAVDYFHGFDKLPAFSVAGTATVSPSPGHPQPFDLLAELSIEPEMANIDVFGFDFSAGVGPVIVRGEGAYVRGRLLNRIPARSLDGRTGGSELSDLVSRVLGNGQAVTVPIDLSDVLERKDVIEFGIGTDYTVSDLLSRRLVGSTSLSRTFLLFQVLQTVIRHHDRGLVDDEAETLLGGTVRRDFWDHHLLLEAKGAYSIGGGFFARPRLSYQPRSALTVSGEIRIIGGPRNRTIGQFGNYDEVKLEVRYDF